MKDACFDQPLNVADGFWNLGARKRVGRVGIGIGERLAVQVDVPREWVDVGAFQNGKVVVGHEIELIGEKLRDGSRRESAELIAQDEHQLACGDGGGAAVAGIAVEGGLRGRPA